VLAVVYLVPAAQFAVNGAVLQTIIPIVGDRQLDLDVSTIGYALGIGGLFRLAAAVVSGVVSDKVSRRAALIPGQLLQAAGVATLMFGGPGAWIVSILLITLGSAGVNLAATVLADVSEGSGIGARLGTFRFTGDAAFLVAPVLAGWLYEQGGRALSLLPTLALAVVVTVGIVVFVPETHRGRDRRERR
jgi:MFS family permease